MSQCCKYPNYYIFKDNKDKKIKQICRTCGNTIEIKFFQKIKNWAELRYTKKYD